ncbi:MAG: hypothetical protein R3A48_23915 [Polyangiales bacterium]
MRAALALALALSVAPLAARADPVDPRLALLDRDATHARIWYWGFTTVYSISAVGQTVLALTLDDPGLRVDAAVVAGSSLLAVGGMIISPIPNVWRAAEDAHRTGDLAAAMTRAADAERRARAWYNHLLVGVVAITGGVILWAGYDRPVSAAVTFGSSLLVGELNLLTMPTRAAGWRDPPAVTWRLAPSLHGVQLVGTW